MWPMGLSEGPVIHEWGKWGQGPLLKPGVWSPCKGYASAPPSAMDMSDNCINSHGLLLPLILSPLHCHHATTCEDVGMGQMLKKLVHVLLYAKVNSKQEE